MFFKRVLLITAGCVALAACNTANSHYAEEDPALGEAVKFNAAVQTINPDPVYADSSTKPGSEGSQGVAAVQRYRKDEVNKRHEHEVRSARAGTLSTTSGEGGGSTPQ